MVQPIGRVRTTLTFSPGGPGLMTHYFLGAAAGTFDAADAGEAYDRVHDFLNAIKVYFSTTMTLDVQAQVDVLEASTGALVNVLSATPQATITGTGSGGQSMTFTNFLLRGLTTSFIGGRRLASRSFIGPPAAGSANRTAPASVDLADIQAQAATFLLRTTTAMTPAVWHRPSGPGATDGVAASVTAYTTSPKWAVLRSRRD